MIKYICDTKTIGQAVEQPPPLPLSLQLHTLASQSDLRTGYIIPIKVRKAKIEIQYAEKVRKEEIEIQYTETRKEK